MRKPLRYYSTNFEAPEVSFREALLKGQAPDRGLYMPKELPHVPMSDINNYSAYSYPEIAFDIAKRFLEGEIELTALKSLVEDAYDYDVPLEPVYERKYVMRLDQGPTASFKDFAARMMARLMQYFLKKENRKLLILTATSGDTGSAIAHAYYGLDNINVVVLFPKQEVSNRQRKQMTTLSQNITTIGIDGKFDDCQAFVKQAFADEELEYLNLTSANSINFGRLLPQTVYYFYAYSKLQRKSEQITFCVPSGNFGDMMGGILASKMGLPVKRFVIATNENDEFPKFLNSGTYNKIVPSKNCLSSAMNVGHPSNLARLITLYGGRMDETGKLIKSPDLDRMKRDIYSVSIDDEKTKATIKSAWEKHKLLLEPHGSVGWAGLLNYLEDNDSADGLFVSLETAHPAKFPELIRETLDIDPELPHSLEGLEEKEEFYEEMDTSYEAFKEFLKKKF